MSLCSKKLFNGMVVVPLAAGLALSGCVAKPSLTTFNNPADVCNAYRQPIIATEKNLAEWTVAGAVGGAVVAAGLTAALSKKASGGEILRNAIIAGTATGLTSYLAARQQQNANQQQLLAAINGDATADRGQVSEVRTSINRLSDCRRQQIAQVKRELQRGTITKADALAKADAIQASINDDNALIANVLGTASSRAATYTEAREEVLNGGERGRVTNVSRPAATATATTVKAVYLPPPEDVPLRSAGGVYSTKESVKIRRGPGTSYEVLRTIPKSTTVTVTGATEDGKWSAISVNNEAAFVSSNALAEYKPASELEALEVDTQIAQVTAQSENARTQRDLASLRSLI